MRSFLLVFLLHCFISCWVLDALCSPCFPSPRRKVYHHEQHLLVCCHTRPTSCPQAAWGALPQEPSSCRDIKAPQGSCYLWEEALVQINETLLTKYGPPSLEYQGTGEGMHHLSGDTSVRVSLFPAGYHDYATAWTGQDSVLFHLLFLHQETQGWFLLFAR